jgi:hypothetical protein
MGGPRRSKRIPRQNMTDIKLPGSWVGQISSWVGCSKVLDTAIAALATAFIGCRRRDTQLIHSSTASYTTALRLLRDAVARPDANDRDDLIATALVMTMIEVFMPAEGGAGWQSHIEGCCMLLNTRGQKTGTTPFTNDLILIARYQGVRIYFLFRYMKWSVLTMSSFMEPSVPAKNFSSRKQNGAEA